MAEAVMMAMTMATVLDVEMMAVMVSGP